MKKLPKKYTGVYIGAIVSTVMSVLMSLFVTYMNLGFSPEFFSKWFVAFSGAWPIAFMLSIVITPIAKAFVDSVTTE